MMKAEFKIESADDLNRLRDTSAEPIGVDRWHEMLNVLPPCRWCTHDGVNMFHISEAYTLDLYSWFTRDDDGNYFEFMDRGRSSCERIAKRHKAAIRLHSKKEQDK